MFVLGPEFVRVEGIFSKLVTDLIDFPVVTATGSTRLYEGLVGIWLGNSC